MLIDRSYRQNLHKVLENYLDDEVIEKGNLEKSWFYGYHEEHDLVVISKDGTIGQILEINDLKIALPSIPKQVRNSQLKQEFQKWRRYDVPKELSNFDRYFSDESNIESILNTVYRKHKDFIEKDIHRIKNGDFFYNDGEIIYITGFYYFFLQHYFLTDMNRYGEFRMAQRDSFIFDEACFADNRCFGPLRLKGRRSYFSTGAGSMVLCKAIFSKNANFPIVSKKEEDANILFSNHIVKPLIKLPKHLQPQRGGENEPKKEILFTAAKKKITTNQKLSNTGSEGNNSRIKALGTTVDAYDGWQVKFSINDEIGKLKGNLDINEYWNQSHKMCHIVGRQIVGKAICGSTANPPNLGGRNYEIFYNNSKISSRGSSGRTKTGLYALFIPADFTVLGYCDEYGYSIIDDPKQPVLNDEGVMIDHGAKKYLDSLEQDCQGNQKALNEQKRNNPRIDTDAFLDEDATSMYATEGINSLVNFLRDFEKTPKYQTQVFKYNLSWVDGIQDNEKGVVLTHSKEGRFMGNWLPPMEMRNVIIMKDGVKYPSNPDMGCFGADPYQSDRAKYGTGSKQGFTGLLGNNSFLLNPKDFFKQFLYYNFRPFTLEDAIDDIIKAIVFFGMKINPETNKKALVTALYKRGYRKYVLDNPFVPKSQLSAEEKKYGGTVSSPSTVPLMESALESFIYQNIPDDVDEDNMKFPYLRMNEELQIYNGDIRKKCDSTVALQMAASGLTATKRFKEKPKTEEVQEYNIFSLFERN